MQTKFLKALMYETQYKDYSPDFVMYGTLLEKNIPVIEFGSGTGRITLHLLEQGYRVWGIENDEDYKNFLLNKIQEKGLKSKFNHVKDLTEINDRCNIIYPFNVLFHLNKEEVEKELNKLQDYSWNKVIIETDNIQTIFDDSFQAKQHQYQNYLFREYPIKDHSRLIIHNEVIDKEQLQIVLNFDYPLYLHKADYLANLYRKVFPCIRLYGDFSLKFYNKQSSKLIAVCVKESYL
jgi:SAM-dependent methyltransferase